MFIRKILFTFLVGVAVLLPASIFAQGQGPLGPEDCAQYGLVWDTEFGCVLPVSGNNTGQDGDLTNTGQDDNDLPNTGQDGGSPNTGQDGTPGSGGGGGGTGGGGTGGGTGGNTGTSGACLTSFAIGQTPRNFCELMSLFLKLLNSIIPLLVALAIVFFIWGVIQYVINPASSEEREKGQQYMIWGIVGIFCIVSIWGLVALLTGTFGISTIVIPQLQQQ